MDRPTEVTINALIAKGLREVGIVLILGLRTLLLSELLQTTLCDRFTFEKAFEADETVPSKAERKQGEQREHMKH